MTGLDRRVPEPELMEDPDQARAYSEADFAGPHQAFADAVAGHVGDRLRPGATVLDVGCGPADVTVRVARALPGVRVLGIDGSEPMLELGRRRVAAAGVGRRVALAQVRLPDDDLLARRFDATVSNSLLHHLGDPRVLWRVVAACTRRGGPVAVMDLRRPADDGAVDAIVAREAAGAPDVLRRDLRASLRAAWRPDEVRAQLAEAGLGHLEVHEPTDRHLLVLGWR